MRQHATGPDHGCRESCLRKHSRLSRAEYCYSSVLAPMCPDIRAGGSEGNNAPINRSLGM